jgi:hypothetical protein
MIGSRGFRMVEPPRASSGSARIRRSLAVENREPLVNENWRRPRIAAPRRSRSPPGRRTVAGSFRRELAEGQHRPPDTALGQRVPPPAQANQSPPESTTERSQL